MDTHATHRLPDIEQNKTPWGNKTGVETMDSWGDKHQALSMQLQRVEAELAISEKLLTKKRDTTYWGQAKTAERKLTAITKALEETVMPRDIRRQLLEIIK